MTLVLISPDGSKYPFYCVIQKLILKIGFLHNKKILRTAGGLWIANSTALLLKNKAQKKSPANCGAFYIQKISRNYFFSDFSILA
ncbi:MAG: hypothetical protein U0945_01600, partial [Flavobacterium sp.]|nr:hypothetical protein [Flavobacterium sp.]